MIRKKNQLYHSFTSFSGDFFFITYSHSHTVNDLQNDLSLHNVNAEALSNNYIACLFIINTTILLQMTNPHANCRKITVNSL